jgi:adenylate cyclase
LLAAGLLIVAGTFGAFAALYRLGYLNRFELLAYDIGVNQRSRNGAIDSRIAIIGVTEEDSVRFGWPLPDQVLAEAIESLIVAGVRVVAIDFFRDHPVEPGGARLDRVLRDNAGVIWISRMGDPDHVGIDPPQALVGTRRYGFADVPLDDDGIVRRALLYQQVDGKVGAGFALTAAQAYLRDQGIKATPAPFDPGAIALGKAVFAPLGPDDGAYVGADTGGFQIMIDYIDGRMPFRLASLGALLDGAVPLEDLRDRIVFVGTTTESVKDFFYTPLDLFGSRLQSTHGIVLHAVIASQILRRAIDGSAATLDVGAAAELAWILLWAAGGGIVGYLGSGALRLSAFVALGVVAIIGGWYMALAHWAWLPLVAPLLAWSCSAALTLPATLGYRRLVADRDRRFIREAFDRFLAPEVIDDMMAKGTLPTLGGEERTVTVLFSDIENYSTLSERISPTETVSIINRIFTSLTAIVQSRRGFVMQFVGDAMVAVFNAPVEDHDHATNAVSAALECDLAMRDLLGRITLPSDIRVRVRFGINTGRMVVGNIGSERRLNYTAIGDGINVAARLEGANKVYLTSIIASEDTVTGCGGRIFFRELDRVAVKGRGQPIRIYEPLVGDDPRAKEATAFGRARALYLERRFAEAADAFGVLATRSDPTSNVLAQRCRAYERAPPDATWDGVFELSEK